MNLNRTPACNSIICTALNMHSSLLGLSEMITANSVDVKINFHALGLLCDVVQVIYCGGKSKIAAFVGIDDHGIQKTLSVSFSSACTSRRYTAPKNHRTFKLTLRKNLLQHGGQQYVTYS